MVAIENKKYLSGNVGKQILVVLWAMMIVACASAPQPQEPVPGITYFNRAVDAVEKGRYLAAIEQYSRYIELHEDSPQYAVPALNNRGSVYLILDRYQNAIDDFTRAAQLDPNVSLTYINRGNVYAQMGKVQESIKDYTHAVDLDESNGLAYSNRGLAWSSLKRFDMAITDFDKAIALGHDGVDRSLMKRGVLLFGTKDYQGAIDDFTQVIKLMPSYYEAYYFRGQAYQLMGNPEKAQKDFDQARALQQESKKRNTTTD